MAKKPTYEELEGKVSELQKEVIKLKQVEKDLKESERMLNETQTLAKNWWVGIPCGRETGLNGLMKFTVFMV